MIPPFYHRPSKVKGNAPLEDSPIADYEGAIVHDHDKAYYNFGRSHAECNVHILRALKGIEENEPEKTWAAQMRTVLSEAGELAKDARMKDSPCAITQSASMWDMELLETVRAVFNSKGDLFVKAKQLPQALSS